MIRRNRFAAIAAITVVSSVPALAADRYEIDSSHAWVGMRVQHFGLVDMVCGMPAVKGEIVYDSENLAKSSVSIEIDTTSLDCLFDPRTEAVKSPAFLDVAKHGKMMFVSEKVTKTGTGTVAVGKLTVHGVTKSVELPFELLGPVADPWGNTRIGIRGELEIDRTEFGITFDRKTKEGTPLVGRTVAIDLSVEAIKVVAQAKE